MDNLMFLGINVDAMNKVIDTCEEVLKNKGFDIVEIDRMNDIALSKFHEYGTLEDITSSIIDAYFSATQYVLEEKFPDINVEYCVNGDVSDLYIDGELQ